MANIGEINVGMSLDATDFGSGLAEVKAEVRTFGSDLDRVGSMARNFLGGFAAYKTLGFVTGIAKDAAAAEEGISGLAVVFGQRAGEIEKFSRDMANTFGISLNTMLDAEGRLGSMFEGAGLDASQIAKMSRDMGKLAIDYSRFKNTTIAESLDKMISGLSGEAEPLRAFGIFLDEASVKAKGLEMGLGNLRSELTEGEKIQARYALVMDKGAIAMGSAEREASGAAAKIEALSGAWDNFKISLGETVAPAVASVFHELTIMLNNTREFVDWAKGEGASDPRMPPPSGEGATAAPLPSDDELRKMAAILNEQWDKHLSDAAQAAFLNATPFKDALKLKPILGAADWHALLNPEKLKATRDVGFAGAASMGSREWASTILRNRFGGGKDDVADNTKATATNTAKIATAVSAMTGKLETLLSEPAPDWK